MHALRVLAGLLLVDGFAACAPGAPPDGADFSPPYLVSTNLPADGQPMDLSGPLLLRFSEPLDQARLEEAMIVIVPHELGAPCATELSCSGGDCCDGMCQRDRVDEAWIADLANPPLAKERRAQAVPLLIELEADARVVRLVPQHPLGAGQRHTLLVGPGLVDLAGNPALRPDDTPLVLRTTFVTGMAARGRPLLRLASPPAGTSGLPTNLARVMFLSSEAVRGVTEQAVWLELSTGHRVKARVTGESPLCQGQAAGCCYILQLEEALPPNEIVQPRIDENVIMDSSGQHALVEPEQFLATGPAADHAVPRLDPLRLISADRCVVVRLRTEEPSDLTLRASWRAEPDVSIGATLHELALPIPAIQPDNALLELTAQLRDLSGNEAPPSVLTIEPPQGPRVAITEVLANPAGPEPAQEFVELLNLSSESVDVTSWTIDDNDDGAGAAVLPPAILGPGQYAVVVGKGYQASTDTDPTPALAALLVRLSRVLGADGLSNSGELLTLRDREGRLVSSYGSHHAVSSKRFNGRSVERIPADGCDVKASWQPNPSGSSTPGAPP